jgi:hypothetical protein
MSNVDTKTVDVDKSPEDDLDLDLERHRVGGRLVTKREIARSRKCEFLLFYFLLHFSDDDQLSTNLQPYSGIWSIVKSQR